MLESALRKLFGRNKTQKAIFGYDWKKEVEQLQQLQRMEQALALEYIKPISIVSPPAKTGELLLGMMWLYSASRYSFQVNFEKGIFTSPGCTTELHFRTILGHEDAVAKMITELQPRNSCDWAEVMLTVEGSLAVFEIRGPITRIGSQGKADDFSILCDVTVLASTPEYTSKTKFDQWHRRRCERLIQSSQCNPEEAMSWEGSDLQFLIEHVRQRL